MGDRVRSGARRDSEGGRCGGPGNCRRREGQATGDTSPHTSYHSHLTDLQAEGRTQGGPGAGGGAQGEPGAGGGAQGGPGAAGGT